jgi:hypothetical protein
MQTVQKQGKAMQKARHCADVDMQASGLLSCEGQIVGGGKG